MKQHFGSSLVGFIVGLVVGLAIALGIAVYVTKVPIPFLNKGQNRSAVQDAEEVKKNKDWDPNAPLYGKNPARPDAVGPASGSEAKSAAAAASAARAGASGAAARVDAKNSPSGDPLGDLVRDRSAAGGLDPFTYYVQVGAFRTPEDAEAQRAKLSLLGLEAKVSEREQSGRTVYRVRVGPFDRKDDADKSKAKLDAASLETALVRVQR